MVTWTLRHRLSVQPALLRGGRMASDSGGRRREVVVVARDGRGTQVRRDRSSGSSQRDRIVGLPAGSDPWPSEGSMVETAACRGRALAGALPGLTGAEASRGGAFETGPRRSGAMLAAPGGPRTRRKLEGDGDVRP